MEGTYDVSGNILLLPIKGTGPFVGNFSKKNYIYFFFQISYLNKEIIKIIFDYLIMRHDFIVLF